jgi:hypothetical protein
VPGSGLPRRWSGTTTGELLGCCRRVRESANSRKLYQLTSAVAVVGAAPSSHRRSRECLVVLLRPDNAGNDPARSRRSADDGVIQPQILPSATWHGLNREPRPVVSSARQGRLHRDVASPPFWARSPRWKNKLTNKPSELCQRALRCSSDAAIFEVD